MRGKDWEEYYTLKDPGEAWDCILKNVTPILDDLCPLRTFHIKNYRPDWMTNELIEQIKDRDYFYKKAKKNGDKDSWNIARYLRNVTNTNIRQAKREFILNELRENENNCKKFWKVIREIIPSDKSSSEKDIVLQNGDREIQKNQVAQFINNYFINIVNPPIPNGDPNGVCASNLDAPPPPVPNASPQATWSLAKLK